MKTITVLLTELLSHPKIPKFLKNWYLKKPIFWNYMLICGIGVIINQIVLHFSVNYVPLFLADFLAIGIAFVWNYTNALGKLKKYWGME